MVIESNRQVEKYVLETLDQEKKPRDGQTAAPAPLRFESRRDLTPRHKAAE